MPKDTSIHKILLIGSGPITIGQACEFDYSGTQAQRALKAEGYSVLLVNSNPATIMTDPEFSDQVYIEPLTPEFLERIIEREKPDALLPTMGGQTALNLAVALAEKGVLKKYGVKLIGASLESIKKAEDRLLFKQAMEELGIDIPKSELVESLKQARDYLEKTGLPVILRPSFTLGGEGGGVAYTNDEFERLIERGLFLSPTHSVLIEESLIGWKEYELEVVRDCSDNVIIVCSIENLDPMGIHTGDSITVAPAQTLTNRQYQHLRELAKKIIRAINIDTGGSNIQFAVKPFGSDAGRTVVIEMNPRVSRSSALASKATGFPIAKVAARLSVGYTLDELTNEITGSTPVSFEPTIDYVVTKIPRFDFAKFTATPPLLGTQMKSVGEVMAIGRTFKESLMKAISGLETEVHLADYSLDELKLKLKEPLWNRLWYVFAALRKKISVNQIAELTGIDPWFISQMQEIVDAEKYLSLKPMTSWSSQEWIFAKQFGFSDKDLAQLTSISEEKIRTARHTHEVYPVYSQVDTCAGEFEAQTPYLYSTYNDRVQSPAPLSKAILILGGGPNRIGQGIEFDYCCVHASMAVQKAGLKSILVNCNPETVSTDYDVSSRLYFEPVTIEHVLEILKHEKNVQGVIVQFGGQTPLKLAAALHQNHIPILGTSVENIDIAEDRERFGSLMRTLEPLGLKQPIHRTARSVSEALRAAEEVGFPVMIRPSYVLGGRGMQIIFSQESLKRYISNAIEVSEQKPVLLDRFLSNAIEVDVDAISDGSQTLIAGIMEHIEEAGIHSGDSACSIPPFTIPNDVKIKLREYTRILASKLNVIGFINIQFAVQNSEVYVLEVNPRASRTVPFISKAIGLPLSKIATQVIIGKKLNDLGYHEDFDLKLDGYSVKMPVFPFHKFPGVDVLLGPEMKSTGEVMGRAHDFASAYAKALLGAGIQIPTHGRALLSIADEDKDAILELAKQLIQKGFTLDATPGTHGFLKAHRIDSEKVWKVGQGSPDCVMQIAAGRYQLILNTTNGEKAIRDSYTIRRTSLEKRIPYCTLITAARAYLQAISKRQLEILPLSPLKGT